MLRKGWVMLQAIAFAVTRFRGAGVTIRDAMSGRFYLYNRVIDVGGARSGFSSLDGAMCTLTGGGEGLWDGIYALTSGGLERGGRPMYA